MLSIDPIEVLVGILGLACSIYDPWIGDPYASVLVICARTAGICTLFLIVVLSLATLIPLPTVDVDPTTLAIVFFAAGSSAPTLARGSWFLIDVGTLFMDLLQVSYRNGQGNVEGPTPFGVSNFVNWIFAVFYVLMQHNVTWEKIGPHAGGLLNAFRNNCEEFVHGQAIRDGVAVWNVSRASWATRAKAFFNIIVLNFAAFGFLVLQLIAALGEAILLSIGSVWISLAIAASAKGFKDHERLGRISVLDVVKQLICCNTCHHGGTTGRLLKESDNNKAVSKIMPKVVRQSKENSSNTNTRCSCCFCSCGFPRA
ncbi:unnamed protein product [Pylaiella littoralis]